MTHYVDTQVALAKILEVSAATVKKWKADGMPVCDDGKFDVEEVRAWRAKHKRPGRPSDMEKLGEDPDKVRRMRVEKLKADTAWRKERAKIERIKREELEGELIRVEQVEEVLASRATLFRKSLMNLGRRLSLELHGQEPRVIQDTIERECRRILSELARSGASVASGLPDLGS